MQERAALLVMGVACLLSPAACTTRSDAPSAVGGASGAGGAGGRVDSGGAGASLGAGGSGVSCSSGAACGGDVLGTWTVTSSCLSVSGALDLSLAGAGCRSAPVVGSLKVSGTWTANADSTYSDDTVTTGEEQITLAPACLVISSTPVTCAGAGGILKSLGYATFDCTDAGNGGCNCSATVNQQGGLGVVSPSTSATGNYSKAGNVLTISGDVGDVPYSYCTAGDQLTLTPESPSPTVTGSIVLQKSAASGAGGFGAGGSGAGVSGAGTSATGGAAATGGVAAGGGAGGRNAGGGMSGTGAGGRSAGGAAGAGPVGGASSGGGSGTGGSGSTQGPCDIYKSGGTPCVAAHSTVRALFASYGGKLYQVRNSSGTTKDVSAVSSGGVADASAQDAFCSGTTCVITTIYDQTGNGNDLQYQGSGSSVGGQDKPASATGESIKLGGSKVYSLYIKPSNSYWVDGSKSGMPLGSAPEGMYMVTSGTHSNSGCCFDYGNSETDRKYDGPGTMDALNFSSITSWGTGAGAGPWVLADLEAGLFAQGGSGKNQSDPTQTSTFVTAVLKNNGTSEFTLQGGDATSGSLSTYYKGGLPGGWSPMKKQGALVLGSGGDCCATNTNLSEGTFYEGSIVSGYPSDATENAVQANIVAAGYAK